MGSSLEGKELRARPRVPKNGHLVLADGHDGVAVGGEPHRKRGRDYAEGGGGGCLDGEQFFPGGCVPHDRNFIASTRDNSFPIGRESNAPDASAVGQAQKFLACRSAPEPRCSIET